MSSNLARSQVLGSHCAEALNNILEGLILIIWQTLYFVLKSGCKGITCRLENFFRVLILGMTKLFPHQYFWELLCGIFLVSICPK